MMNQKLHVKLVPIIVLLTLVSTLSQNIYGCGDGGCSVKGIVFNKSEDINNSLNPVEYVVSDKYPFIVLPIDIIGRFDILNPTVDPRGLPLLEGDMLYEPEDDEQTLDDLERKFLPGTKNLWPNDPFTGWPTVPFVISPSVENIRDTILEAIALWENTTCINFQELDSPRNSCHVSFVEDSGCWSYVGRQYKKEGPQSISIGSGCKRVGTIAHEIGHALGMLHEQSRSDRDDHVMVMWENIMPNKWRNFKKRPSDNENVPYDTSSIMHYGSFFFSKTGAVTVMTKNPFHQWHLGQRERLTFRDIQIVNNMYGCGARWVEECRNTSMLCENGGYTDEWCSCTCPPGTKGERCQIISGSYFPDLECGGNVTTPLNISSPNFPDPFPSETWCMWWAQAGECQRVRVIFHEFDLLYRSRKRCYWDYLEIRNVDPLLPGYVYCESEVEKEQAFYSKNGSLFISFYGKYEYAKGFAATIDFTDDPYCNDATKDTNSTNNKN